MAHFKQLFEIIHQAVTGPPPDDSGLLGQNPKGDQVKWFDLAADRAVCAYLDEYFPVATQLLSEEGEPRRFGSGPPRLTLVLDPVDGSENFSRGLAPAGVAIAAIPFGMPIAIENVQCGLVGNLFSKEIWSATRGQGARYNDVPTSTAPITAMGQALLNCDFNQAEIPSQLSRLTAQARGIRSGGAAAVDIARVANRVFDAHVDIRDLLTPENFLASSLIVTEAGGIVSGGNGESLPALQSLTERYSIIAAATPQLHTALIEALHKFP